MASKGTPLGIGLAIDFSALDAQLSKVAEKIEKVGSTTELKIGTAGALAAKDPLNIDKMADQMTRVGANLATSLSSGMGVSNALLLSFAAKINALLDQMSKMMLTMFDRIDVAMKGHRWTNMLTGMSNALGNFASGAGKKLSPLDKALGGSFGQNAKIGAAVFNTMFENLAKKMTDEMTKAAKTITDLFGAKGPAKALGETMIKSLDAIKDAVQELSRTFSTSMITAINQVVVKMKDMRSSAEGVKGAGPGRPYVRQPGAIKEMKPIVDVEANLKPPSKAALDRFAKSVDMGMRSAGAEVKLPSGKTISTGGGFEPGELTSKPLKRPSPKMEFKGAMPDPGMFKVFQSVVGDTVATVKKIPEVLKQIPGLIRSIPSGFDVLIASGSKTAMVIGYIGKGLYTVGSLAVGAVVGITRLAAGLAAMGLAAAAGIGRMISFFGTLGSVGKHTFGELRAGHNAFAAGILISTKLVYHLVRGLWDLVTLRAFRRVGDDAKVATGAVGKLTGSIGRLGTELAAALGLIGLVYKVVEFFKGGVKAATELNAVTLRTKLVFGESTAAIEAQAETLARSTGVTKAAQLEMAAGFGSMGQAAGMSEQASAKMANELTSLAVDLTAIGITIEESSEAFKSGLSGRAVSIKQFGAVINEDTVKAQMLKDKLTLATGAIMRMNAAAAGAKPIAPVAGLQFGAQKKLAAEHAKNQQKQTADAAKHDAIRAKNKLVAEQRALPKAQRVKPTVAARPAETEKANEVAARGHLILQGLAYAQGVAAKTANTASVQFQKAGGGIKMFAEKIGEILLPALQAATTGFNALMGSVLDMVSAAGPAIKRWSTESAGVITDFIKQTKEFGPQVLANLTWLWDEAKKGPLGFVFKATESLFDLAKMIPEMIGIGVRNAGDLWKIAELRVGDFANNVMAYIKTIPANFGIIFPWILDNWKTLLMDLVYALTTIGANLLENAWKLGQAVWSALRGGGFQFQWTPLLEGFKAATEQLPELIKPAIFSSQEEIDKLYAKIGEREFKRPKYKGAAEPDLTGKKPPPPEEKKTEYKIGGALEVGSKEAFSALSRNIAGRSSTTDAVKQGVAVQKDHLGVAKQQLAVMQNQAKMPALAVK